jgi:uncharacterized protein YidB (DUF937 family)
MVGERGLKEDTMGLMDILNGMQNGPRGQRQPTPAGGSGGGLSPMMMALLGLLAYKAMQGGGLGNILGGSASGQPRPAPGPGRGGLEDLLGGMFGGGRSAGPSGGGFGDLLGGMLGGAGAGSVLGGGLGKLIQDMQASGQGKVAQSWVGTGGNEDIAPGDLEKALGADVVGALQAQTGLPRAELLSGLSEYLPQMVDQLTPDGRLPTADEAARW